MEEKYDLNNDLRRNFDSFKNNTLKELEVLKALISQNKNKQIIHPVFKWGQSKSDILIFMKLSHRFGSPGCLDVIKDPTISVDEFKFNFTVECIQATQPLIFILNFDLFEKVDKFILDKDSVGTYSLTLKKSEDKIWPDLFKDPKTRENYNPKIWYELEEVHKDDMNEFYEIMEVYNDKNSGKKKKKKRKRRNTCRNKKATIIRALNVISAKICKIDEQ